jgi:signal transduction histidine kinase
MSGTIGQGELVHDTWGCWAIYRLWTVPGRTLALAGLSQLGLVLMTPMISAMSMMHLGIGVLTVPLTAVGVRWATGLSRKLAGDWSGVPIAEPYRPQPRSETGFSGWWQRCWWILSDPATWRDLLWLFLNAIVGFALLVIPASLVLYGTLGLAMPFVWQAWGDLGGDSWYGPVRVTSAEHARLAVLFGVAILGVALAANPWLLRLHGRFARLLLAPTPSAELSLRVQHLTETRSDAVDTSAAELRRIERDLHDGAQARLVAMGMNLGAAERLIEENPAAARALLTEARDASVKALNELRDLVRGIHPPVLADRGLADAVRALALESPLRTEVSVDLPGRPQPPVESAAYFAVSEMLTNAAKHARAQRVWIDIRYSDGMLRISVTDDGVGGADPSRGSGLRGIERRLATFDGVLAVSSPAGGPTLVNMEVPCVLSSPKTSPS